MNWPRVSFRILILLSIISISAPAQWTSDPAINTPVCTADVEQYHPEMIPLDAGGVIIAWHDSRSGATTDMYVQKIDSTDGVLQAWQWISRVPRPCPLCQ